MKYKQIKTAVIEFDNEFKTLNKKQQRTFRIKERMIKDSAMLVLRWRKLKETAQ